ncbi:hypothetical protein ACEYW6_10440 [Nostoc sp. UIC 10607]
MTTNNSSNIVYSSSLHDKSTNIPSIELNPTKVKIKGRRLTNKQRMIEQEIMNEVNFALENNDY